MNVIDLNSQPILRPPIPNPTASSAEVHEFIVQFLLSQDFELTRDEARVSARKIKADGKTLYDLEEKIWIEELGHVGETIYHALQISWYGCVSSFSTI